MASLIALRFIHLCKGQQDSSPKAAKSAPQMTLVYPYSQAFGAFCQGMLGLPFFAN